MLKREDSFLTDLAEGLRVYLESRGVKVPDKLSKSRIGNLNLQYGHK